MILLQLRIRRLSLIFWSLFFFLFMIVGLSEASFIIGEDSAGLAQIFDSIPKYILAPYGFSTFDFTTYEGFYGIMALFAILAISIYSFILLSGLFANEEEQHSFEYSLTRPFKREYVAISKYLAATFLIFISSIVILIASLIAVSQFEQNIYQIVFQTTFLIFCSGLFMLGICAIVLFFVSKFKNAIKINGIIMLVFYMIFVAYQLNPDGLNALFYLNPLSLFGAQNYIDNLNMFIPIIISLVFYIIGFILIRKSFKNVEIQ